MRVLLASFLILPYLISLSVQTNEEINSSTKMHTNTDSAHADTLVKMERTVCFGTCPSYVLIIQKDGNLTFIGKEFVENKGMATDEISQENLDQLIKKIDESHFMQIPSDPECKSRYTDMPSVFLTIDLDGERNSLTHYHGCKGFEYEEELFALEEAIDSLAGTDKWIGRDN